NRAIRDEINASNSTTRSTATAEVRELRQEYFETHDTWVDANGTAYNANYNATTGAIELARDEKPTPADPAKNIPATRTSRRVTIATDRSREDIGITATVPTGRVGETNQVRTERVATDPAGNKTDSSIRLEQERRNADGSTERSVNEEQYNAQNKATSRHQEQSTTKANGDVTSSSTDTNFAPDGTTPTQTVSRSHSQTGSGDSQRVDDRATTTYYLADGVTPRHQQVVESGTDKPTTTALTDFDAQGEPTDTFIRRDGGDLPEGVTRTEYVTWGPNGDVARRLNGGEGVSEYEFETFAKTGAGPEVLSFADWNRQNGGNFVENAVEYAQYVGSQKLEEGDPNAIPGGEDPVKWVRGDDDRFTAENLNGNLVEPLTPATSTPSVFDVPAQLTARANAEAIDNSPYAPGGPRFEELNTDQRSYEQRIAGASTDAQREAIMSEYFGTHDYWIDRGTKPGDAPVLMASGWSEGAPSSTMFGASRAADPHATLARTGMEGTDDLGQPATLDLVTNLYTDGTRDDITRSTYDGPAGASRVRVSGEHTNAAGVVTEHDVNSQSRVSRTAQGLEPLAVTEVSRERFNEVTGKPQGEQYFGVASSDSRTTTLEERKDYYTTDGVIYDTKIDATSMSRNYDADLTRDFLATNQDVIDQARSDDFSPNSDGETVTTPPVGSNYSTTHTDIDYSSTGVAVYQKTDESSTSVEDADDDNHNGVRVIETNTTKESGTQGGTAPIFDDAGKLIVDVKLVSTVKSTEFDPDAGVAGGNKSAGHQFREITSVTVGSTTHPDGSKADQWATPFKTQTLREGFDDDWQFVEKNLKTQSTGELVIEGEGDEAHPVELGDDTEIYNSRGERVNLDDAKIEHEDLDFADKFEEFMEGWGGKIIGVAGVVVGVALIATGVGSPLGVALAAGGVALASTQLAYTAINYSQGEASGLDLAIAGAGVALSVVPAITGVRQLAAAGRGARALSAARAAGAADDVARGIADDVIRAGQGGRGAQVVNSTANVGGTGLDAKDGYDATRAALQGDFYGAALMLTAIGAGAGVSRVRGPHVNAGGPTGTPDAPDINSNPTPDLPSGASGAPHGQPGAPGLPSPSTSSGAPSVRPNGTGPAPIGAPRPLPGTNTGAGNSGTNGGGNGNGGGPAAPASTNTGTPSSVDAPSAVGGARGDGVGGPDNASTGAGTDRRPPYEQFNQDAIRGGREVANRGSALDPAVASVRPNTEDGILFSHVANGHAVDPSIAPTAQGFPRRPAASPEVLGFAAGDLPPVGTIVRAPDGYHMVTDANGTTTPVSAKGHPREGSPSDLTTLGATDKWQVPKSQFSPELAGSLRGENTQLQEMVDQAILDPNNTRI
ncbi:MAG: hypothetical protein JWM86_1315, partial [Thermoleophilia bacterium]|nr:hypothetical protein [Thermoleophilia bacterium]